MDKNDKDYKKILIGKRIAKELSDGDFVNLGIGLPTEVANHIPKGINVYFQSENGIMGVGPAPNSGDEDPEMINAGGGFITAISGSAFIDSAMSFAIIRGGHLDMTVLGALQVDQKGNLANWWIPGKFVPGMGGAMDLVSGAKKVVVAMEHCDKNGNSKILQECTLPLTAVGKVNLIVTDMAVMKIEKDKFRLLEIAEGYTIDDIQKATEADLIIEGEIKNFGVN
ncbi:MAG: 3-oxoacid CoA-transferase subunit B [Candidatus Cloacimonetes bacterium]|nr:3-oxoacid CoA-transferase subunit B [Candidatus Cloacimonadota bacterium]